MEEAQAGLREAAAVRYKFKHQKLQNSFVSFKTSGGQAQVIKIIKIVPVSSGGGGGGHGGGGWSSEFQ